MILGIIITFFLVLYLLAVMPRIFGVPDKTPFQGKFYAHGGLHDNAGEAPENSMLAFRRAVGLGYGIEMDVQLTKDRIPVVFHDETLKRACGGEGTVRDFTYKELQEFRLFDSEQRIPLFVDSLNMVNGQVPLIVEIKIHENPKVVCEFVDAVLKEYQGIYCVESFHPLAVRWYRKNRSTVLRGQLASDYHKPEHRESFSEFLVHYLLLNFLAKPDFIAYNHKHKYNVSRLVCKYVFGALSVAWTIRSQNELDDCRKDFDLFIMEGFTPNE